MLHDDRMVGSGFIEIAAIEHAARLSVVVEESDDPFAGCARRSIGMDGRLEGIDRINLERHLREQRRAALARMRMRVVESRRHALAAEVDTLRRAAREREHVLARPDREYPVAGNG